VIADDEEEIQIGDRSLTWGEILRGSWRRRALRGLLHRGEEANVQEKSVNAEATCGGKGGVREKGRSTKKRVGWSGGAGGDLENVGQIVRHSKGQKAQFRTLDGGLLGNREGSRPVPNFKGREGGGVRPESSTKGVKKTVK